MTKIKNLSVKETRAIAEYESLIVGRFPNLVRRLILYGSKARGDSNRNSDIDLLVLLKRSNKYARKEIVSLVHGPIARFGVEISPILANEEEFKHWSPFFARVKDEGITIWKNTKNM